MHGCARLMRKKAFFDRIYKIKLLVTKELKFFYFFGFGRLLCALLVAPFTYFNTARRKKGGGVGGEGSGARKKGIRAKEYKSIKDLTNKMGEKGVLLVKKKQKMTKKNKK